MKRSEHEAELYRLSEARKRAQELEAKEMKPEIRIGVGRTPRTKEGRRWWSASHNRRKRSTVGCVKAGCKKHTLINSIYCAKHYDALSSGRKESHEAAKRG